MEPIIKVTVDLDRALLEKRLARALDTLEKRRRADGFGEADAQTAVEDIEHRLATLDSTAAAQQQLLTEQALLIDDRRSAIAHRTASLEAINRTTEALLKLAEAIGSK